MSTPNSSVSEIIATTLKNRGKKIIDNVSNNNGIMAALKENGNISECDGGETIFEPLEFQENGTFGWYDGYDTLDISPQEVFTAAEFEWKLASVAVTMSGKEKLQNAGSSRLFDLMKARIANAEHTMENKICEGIYSDGTGYGGKQIGGLQYLLADDPTANSPGGISRSTYSWWQHKKYAGVVDGGAAVSSANIQSYMHRLFLQIVRGNEKDYVIAADNNFYRYYWESLTSIQRIASDSEASAGFQRLRYQGAKVVYDGGYGGACPANHMYFINSRYLKFRPHSARNMVPIGGERESVNQDAVVKLLGLAGNMTISNCFTSGVLIA